MLRISLGIILTGMLFLPVAAADEPNLGWSAFLLSGGGVPSSNAVAHEKNLLFVERTLRQRGVEKTNIRMFAGPGPGSAKDTAYIGEFPEDRWELFVLDRLFGRGGVELSFRPHRLTELSGSARRSELLAGLQESMAAVTTGETLLVYTTDHGIRGNSGDEATALLLWGDEEFTVADMRKALEWRKGGRVVFTMSQCFSGAFADVIFAAGDTATSVPNVCGFFAAPADRVSAGCTPELNEAEYDDYTTRLYSALGGVDRAGRKTPGVDFDGNGRVDFSEAHAYAVGSDNTIDVPMRTSEHYLRKIGLPEKAEWKEALEAASPEDLAAWKMLAIKLRLGQGDPRKRIETRLRLLGNAVQGEKRKLASLRRDASQHERELRISLLEKWPMLDSPFHPQFAVVLNEENERIRAFLLSQPSYLQWSITAEKMSPVFEKLANLETEEAWWLRAERLVGHMVRVASLDDGPQRDRYQDLLACERALP